MSPSHRVLARVFLPFALGYFLSYLFRAVNAVIAPDLIGDLALDAATLGLLTSAYFLSFAAFQVPLGMLLDRFGPRRVESGLLLFAAAGALMFALAETSAALIVGRALIGLGVSACLMASFKAAVLWFPPDRLPLANGMFMAAGGTGALAATTPVESLLGVTDWRGLFLLLAVAALVVSALIYAVVPRGPHEATAGNAGGHPVAGLATVLRSRLFWRVAPLTTACQAAFLSIQSLWAGPWLSDVAGFGRDEVAEHLLLMAAAMVAGFLLLGAAAGRLTQAGAPPMAVAVAGMVVFMGVQAALVAGTPLPPALLWMGFGFFGTAGILPYAVLSQSFPAGIAGRVNTTLNLLVFVGAFLGQWAIGVVVGMWPGDAPGSYSATGYQAAFAAGVVIQLLTLVWFCLPRRS